MAVIRKITTKGTSKPEEAKETVEKVETPEVVEEVVAETPVKTEEEKKVQSKRVCYFHKSKMEPAYWDATALRKFMNDRGRILPRTRTATCAKHQRRVSREIKRARFLALLPYSARV